MVIELSGVQFGLKSYEWFEIARPRSGSAISNHEYDFRPKLHDTKFNYHLILFILKSQTTKNDIEIIQFNLDTRIVHF